MNTIQKLVEAMTFDLPQISDTFDVEVGHTFFVANLTSEMKTSNGVSFFQMKDRNGNTLNLRTLAKDLEVAPNPSDVLSALKEKNIKFITLSTYKEETRPYMGGEFTTLCPVYELS